MIIWRFFLPSVFYSFGIFFYMGCVGLSLLHAFASRQNQKLTRICLLLLYGTTCFLAWIFFKYPHLQSWDFAFFFYLISALNGSLILQRKKSEAISWESSYLAITWLFFMFPTMIILQNVPYSWLSMAGIMGLSFLQSSFVFHKKKLFTLLCIGLAGLGMIYTDPFFFSCNGIESLSCSHFWMHLGSLLFLLGFFLYQTQLPLFHMRLKQKDFTTAYLLLFHNLWIFFLLSKLFIPFKVVFLGIGLCNAIIGVYRKAKDSQLYACFLCLALALPACAQEKILTLLGIGTLLCFSIGQLVSPPWKLWITSSLPGAPLFFLVLYAFSILMQAHHVAGGIILIGLYFVLLERALSRYGMLEKKNTKGVDSYKKIR